MNRNSMLHSMWLSHTIHDIFEAERGASNINFIIFFYPLLNGEVPMQWQSVTDVASDERVCATARANAKRKIVSSRIWRWKMGKKRSCLAVFSLCVHTNNTEETEML